MTKAGFNQLLVFLAREESLRLIPYVDPAGHHTIGFGHVCMPSQKPITAVEAAVWLAEDAQDALKVVNRVPVLTEDMQIALASFVFNVGGQAFERSTMFELLRVGDWYRAADEFGRWVHVHVAGVPVVLQGLVMRRAREREIFLRGLGYGLVEKTGV